MASVYLILKLESMNSQYYTGFENVCVCVCVCRGGHVKNWYFSLKDSKGGGISEIKIQNTKKKQKKPKHSEIKLFGNNNNSVPKSKSILNKFEKGEVLRWSLRRKSSGTHCTNLILLC